MDHTDSSYIINRINQLRRKQLEKRLCGREALYFGQLPLLEYIIANPGCKQSDLCESFYISRPAASKSIARLEKNGNVSRQINEADERKYKLFITDKGQKLVEQYRKAFDEVNQLTMKDFTEEDYQIINKLLKRMEHNLEADDGREGGNG